MLGKLNVKWRADKWELIAKNKTSNSELYILGNS